ncbi:hypothetical protein K435DRAFT_799651 [Dendrothele bispora CBS 962.96]|uniref:Uncharacterized protein n=1 Tax=Dendrothele bispora (strain CBS 962.96) TaxID=1314807 RepID=A0A4S8LVR9_DENBC|nr:hypothetical protein K435DRAFT_799651 [Dendrothele bispora CBS 962.96]
MTSTVPPAPYTFDILQDQALKSHFLEKPFFLHLFDYYITAPSDLEASLGEKILLVLALDIKVAIDKNQILPKVLLADDLQARVKTALEELWENVPFVERLRTDKPHFEGSINKFLSLLMDERQFNVAVNPSHSRAHPTMFPRLQPLPQLNLKRYIRQQHEDWYQELHQSTFMVGVKLCVRYNAILSKMQAELEAKEPEKIKEYRQYVKDYQEGKIKMYQTEDGKLEAAGRFYDKFGKQMSKTYDINVFSILVWVGENGRPTFDFRQTPDWSLGGNDHADNIEELQNLLEGILTDQFGPKGKGMKIRKKRRNNASIDPKCASPPPIPKNLERLDRKSICNGLRDYFKSVADWQGGGLKSDLIPWAKLKDGGAGAIFKNHTRCVPDNVTIDAIDDMNVNALKQWYKILLELEGQGETPVVFVDSLLNGPKIEMSRGVVGQQDSSDDDEEEESSDEDSEPVPLRLDLGLPAWFHHPMQSGLPAPDDALSSSIPSSSSLDPGALPPMTPPVSDGPSIIPTLGSKTVPSPNDTLSQRMSSPSPHRPSPTPASTGGIPPLAPTLSRSSSLNQLNSVSNDFQTGALSGRGKKTGPPTRIPPGSPRKKAKAGNRKADSLQSCETLPRRTRAWLPDVEDQPKWRKSKKRSLFVWGVPDPLESIALEAYLSKAYVKELPGPAREDFKKVVEGVHVLDELIKSVDPETFHVPEHPDAPEAINLWAEGCNSGEYVNVDKDLVRTHYQEIESWIEGLKFERVNSMTEDEILQEPWFRPSGQGLSHVLWGLRICLMGYKWFQPDERLPQSLAVTFQGLKDVTTRIRSSPRILGWNTSRAPSHGMTVRRRLDPVFSGLLIFLNSFNHVYLRLFSTLISVTSIVSSNATNGSVKCR